MPPDLPGCNFGRHRVVAGSYAYVPPGTAHRIAEVGPEGCTLLQMHRPIPAPA
jgi:hypothetical protein